MEGIVGEFHQGEKWIQDKLFGKDVAEAHRESVQPFTRIFMPEQHQIFFNENPWLVVGTLDREDGHPRASLISQHGFQSIRGGRGFVLGNLSDSQFEGDKVAENVSFIGDEIGILGIELATRRRNRVNARLVEIGQNGKPEFTFKVQQSFGNCPKYIQARGLRLLNGKGEVEKQWGPYSFEEGVVLSEYASSVIAKTDTFFIATVKGNEKTSEIPEEKEKLERSQSILNGWNLPMKAESNGVDVSHRGGSPGFVKVENDGRSIRWPDFVGNGFFNTLGNIITEPRVSILVMDFKRGGIIQLKGYARINFEDTELPGGARTVSVDISSYRITYGALHIAFDADAEPSPFNPVIGSSGDPLQILGLQPETHDTTSLYFQARRPMRISPGQYGTFRILKDNEELAIRAWTISSTAPDNPFGTQEIVITVKNKKDGKVSPLLNQPIGSTHPLITGSLKLELLGISGDFVLPLDLKEQDRFLFIAAGSGITPMMSMLRRLSKRRIKATLVFSVQTSQDIIFQDELLSLGKSILKLHVAFTREERVNVESEIASFSVGRVNQQLIQECIGLHDYRTAYICGPGSFARFVQDTLNRDFPNVKSILLESYDF